MARSSSDMSEGTTVDSESFREAAAAAVAPDLLTKEILAKHAAGEKLSPAQYGKLGAWKAKLGKMFKGGSDSATAGPADTVEARHASALAAIPESDSPGNGLAPVVVDPRIVKRTTAAILGSTDSAVQRYVLQQARKAGANEQTANRIRVAAALPTDSKELIVEVSPDIIDVFGIDPRQYPVVAAIGALGVWGTNVWLAIDELKSLQTKSAAVDPTRDAVIAALAKLKPEDIKSILASHQPSTSLAAALK